MASVSTRPACSPAREPRLIDCSAQCIVNDEVMRIAVFTPATKTGRWKPSGGHCVTSGLTTRTKKYAVKNAPKSMISDAMKSRIPRMTGLIREE
jgi:hypothetical protein